MTDLDIGWILMLVRTWRYRSRNRNSLNRICRIGDKWRLRWPNDAGGGDERTHAKDWPHDQRGAASSDGLRPVVAQRGYDWRTRHGMAN